MKKSYYKNKNQIIKYKELWKSQQFLVVANQRKMLLRVEAREVEEEEGCPGWHTQ